MHVDDTMIQSNLVNTDTAEGSKYIDHIDRGLENLSLSVIKSIPLLT